MGGQRDSRVLVLSQREMQRPPWHALQYELEDLLPSFDDVDVVSPPAVAHPLPSTLSRRALNGTLKRVGGTRRSPRWNAPSMRPTPVEADHDLFFAVFHYAYQLTYLHRLKGWRERCRRAVCVLVEQWSPEVAENDDYLAVLSAFDRVYLFNPAAAPAIEGLGLPRPGFLPMAVDARAACPLPLVPERVVDVYSYGRSSPSIHQGLLRLAEDDGLFYVYDTLESRVVPEPAEHRALLANLMKRSSFFLAHRINDSPERQERTGGDEGLTTRYFEGVAGGAVVLGSRPRTADFDACFGWPDAVVPVPYDCDDIGAVLDDLRAQPDRLAAIRADNVANSLRRHDWVHRWRDVLASVALAPTPAMAERSAHLEDLAGSATPEALTSRPYERT